MKEIFEKNGIAISEKQEQQLKRYYELLVEWNEKINLTAITDYKEVVRKHFLDSALLLQCEKFFGKGKVLDVGTGAGFPGMVLAIFSPEKEFVLLDSLGKRVDFLKLVADELGLKNVSSYHGRAEDYGRNEEFRNQFDFVVSRAVAELPLLLEYCIPFVKKDGYFVSYKGKKYKEEIQISANAFEQLDCVKDDIYNFLLEEKEERVLLFIKNKELTNSKYPRKAGKPKKKPL